MTARDHLLSGLAGVLVGFVAAYFLFESVAERQPQRRAFHGGDGTAAVVAPGAQPGGPAPGGPAPGEAGPGASPEAPPRAPFLERVNALEAEIAAAPADPEPRLRLAILYFDAGLWPQAEAAFGRYLELRPDDPNALTDLGVSLYQQRRFDEALALFRRVRAIDPEHLQAHFNEAVVLAFGLGRYDEAEAVVEELRRLRPDNPDVERLAEGIEQAQGAA